MKPYIKTYFNYFGYTIADNLSCEVCGGSGADIHHIHRKGMGGSKLLDIIENLMCLCRSCHSAYGDIKQKKAWLYSIHEKVLIKFGKVFNSEWLFNQIKKYE